MKVFPQIILLISLFFLVNSLKGIYYNSIDEVYKYLDLDRLSDNDYQEILEKISIIFSNSYAFNEISKNPPQPYKNYHSIVDIQTRLKKIDTKNINSFEFYRKLLYSLSDLKDDHIRIFMNDFIFNNFYIVGPFNYYIKEYEGQPRLFAECETDNVLINFEDENEIDIITYCENENEKPIKSINNMDPFEYINNFGGKFLNLKNIHGTFSYKMNLNNWVSLKDYPMTKDELNNLQVVFDDEQKTNFTTKYIFSSYTNIYETNIFLNSLKNGGRFYKNFHQKKNINANKENINNNTLRKLSTYIEWNYSYENIFKCYVDEENRIDMYYVGSFEPYDRAEFIKTLIKCVELFDKNDYKIIVLNELNNGGYMSLSQLFMGVLSPLIPINLFKGRLRITESFKKTNDISYYINSNLTNVVNCKKATFDDLIKGRVKTNYSDTDLTQMFFISNITIHNQIEEIRKNMKNKRKPTEILILTDGYTFSSAALYIKYLQKMGGAIIAGYNGNPHKNDIFDSSLSPTGIFTSDLLDIFNSEENNILKNKYNIILEIPGVQTFYDLEDQNVPLEYDVTPVDVRLNLYGDFSDETYISFVNRSIDVFNYIENKCYSPYLIKFDEKCDNKFKKKYIHGGYTCNNGVWSNTCVEAYCDLGYTFNKKEKKCVKDICTSIPIADDDSNYIYIYYLFLFAFLLFI